MPSKYWLCPECGGSPGVVEWETCNDGELSSERCVADGPKIRPQKDGNTAPEDEGDGAVGGRSPTDRKLLFTGPEGRWLLRLCVPKKGTTVPKSEIYQHNPFAGAGLHVLGTRDFDPACITQYRRVRIGCNRLRESPERLHQTRRRILRRHIIAMRGVRSCFDVWREEVTL